MINLLTYSDTVFSMINKLQGGAGGCGLGLVGLHSGHSTTCPVMLGQMGVWLNWLCT